MFSALMSPIKFKWEGGGRVGGGRVGGGSL